MSIFTPLACWLGSKFTSSSKRGLAVLREWPGLGAARVPKRRPEVTDMTDRRESAADSSVGFVSVDVGRIGPTNAYDDVGE
jgi:hypothetical protein